ncbi:MAG: hypothetical protein NC086_05135 [Alistipes sp.]|nr:hypothetical protein [Alistipes sp.]
MSDEMNEGKIIVFNPAGFILKLIFSIAMTAVMASSLQNNSATQEIVQVKEIFYYAVYFIMFWFIASMFGFCLRATGNYIIAVILMFILLTLFTFGISWLSGKNPTAASIAGVAFIVLMIWLPINDIRKAILYFKNTI